jgi:mycothione reductase
MPHHDVIIIGTGSGNTIANRSLRHLDFGIVEQSTFGGTCINVGCIPTKMFVYAAELAERTRDSARFGIDAHIDKVRWADIRDRIFERIDPISVSGKSYRVNGPNTTFYGEHAEFVGPRRLRLASGTELTADRIVIAAGSRAILPDIDGLHDLDPALAHTSDTIMRLDTLPESMVVIGGGVIAAEMAHIYSALATRVTIVARSARLLRHADDDISEAFTALASAQWDVRTSRVAVRVEAAGAGVRVHLADPDGQAQPDPVEGEVLLVATGRVSNADRLGLDAAGISTHDDGRIVVDDYQRTTADGVFALGDVSSSWQLKHVANHEARIVHENLKHPDAMEKADHRFVPHAVFTHPQIAAVGLTERELVEAGTAYVSNTQEYGDVAYGWAMEDTTGFVKVLADPSTGLILGAHLLGPDASSLIQPLIQAMTFGQSALDLGRGQYWIHPALAEVVENALLGLPLGD